ncbi:tetratricopeptide repeat protein [Antarcticibacterium sp. 1MA-6-2]|uniref:tetratricopeptide repeat protein n=1 Tax=Antarcticibacterium sp. 1MA-6-2 TaxID=2908210 RepID=UPI001F2CCF17|nr:tetratricopeptide repeat protein [Antarcticibacterium sp. 1MA-6-2]UJH89836.1 tetratricopeptide repeat protein [Antarcticibacterium sp. 1MA-6-2]
MLQAQSGDCATKAALAYDDAKAQRYDQAYQPLMEVKNECPTYSLATFQYLDRVLKHKLENAQGAEKNKLIEENIQLMNERLKHFPNKTNAAEVQGDIAWLKYENGIGTKEKQFKAFDEAYKGSPESFTSPKRIYAYFSLLVDLQDEGKRDLQDVFELYDEIIGKIESEENKLAEMLAPLVEKQEAGTKLSAQEAKLAENAEINLSAYSQVKGSVNAKLGQRADCDNLIPLYNKDFEEKKGDVQWLRIASERLSQKDCTEDPIFFKVSEALHKAEPSAKSAMYLGQLAEAEGKSSQAMKYYNESAELETDPGDKARVYMRIANNYRQGGNFSQARSFYRKALQTNPSNGRAYLHIANMYAQSANNCGDNPFDKRAVYWLAADYAARVV